MDERLQCLPLIIEVTSRSDLIVAHNTFLWGCFIEGILCMAYTIGVWRSQDLILGGGGGGKSNVRASEAIEPERARCCPPPPPHSESFLHFDVVNGAIWCMMRRYFPRIARIYI